MNTTQIPTENLPENYWGKRFFDILIASVSLVFLFPIFAILFFVIRASSDGPALYWSPRVGRNNSIYKMPKFRSMVVGTPLLATDLIQAQNYVTPIGSFIRKTSLDELPQLWSVLIGDMSLVGPRPALPSQENLVRIRTTSHVANLKPGITGWAQINGRDELDDEAKHSFDKIYLEKMSFTFDLKILFMTARKVLRSEGVHH